MNIVSTGVVILNIVVALALYYVLRGRVELPMMVGVLCGAVTNTPGLGAANEALTQIDYDGPEIAMGYACAYPLGVLGIIGSIILVRYICRVNLKKEEQGLITLCESLGVPVETYTAEQLRAVPGEFTGSDFVKATTGVDSVCERAAVLASGYGPLIQKKTAANGMTFALARYEEAIRFE